MLIELQRFVIMTRAERNGKKTAPTKSGPFFEFVVAPGKASGLKA